AHRPGESRRGDRRFGAGPHGAPRVGGVVRRGTDPRDVSKAGLAGGGLASRAAEGPKTGTCPRGPPVRRPVVAFFPEGAFGPTNNCVGIADVMRRRGFRVVFVVEESFAGTLEARGFEEARMRLQPPPEKEEEPGQFWKDFIRDTAPEFRKPTIEQLATFMQPTWQALIDGSKYVDDRLREIFQ